MANYPFLLMETQISSLVRFNMHFPPQASPYVTSPLEVFTYSFIITFYELLHIYNGVFISDVYKDIMFDMFKWVSENPAPASIMLISSDDSFSRLLYDLSVRRGYNILLAAPSKVCASLTSTANAIWLWSTLISGGSPLKTAEQVTFKIQTLSASFYFACSNRGRFLVCSCLHHC